MRPGRKVGSFRRTASAAIAAAISSTVGAVSLPNRSRRNWIDGATAGAGGGFLEFTANIGDFLVALHEAISNGDSLKTMFSGIGKILLVPINLLKKFGDLLGGLFSDVGTPDIDLGSLSKLKAILEPFLQVEAAAEFIKDNLTESLHIAKLAKLTGLSIRQFERKFHKAYQVSPRAYLVRMRVAAASDLLRSTSLRPSEVATKTGFYDASDFSRQFRRAMKLSPTEYRRLHGTGR